MPATQNAEQLLLQTLERKYRDARPWGVLWRLSIGERRRLLAAVVCFLIKQSPVMAMPIIMANVVNAVTRPTGRTAHLLIVNAVVLLLMLLQNIPMHTLYASLLSRVIRRIQLTLRSAMVVRLQQLSISYHDEVESGRLHSKVLRDVDAVEVLGRQLFNTVLASLLVIVVSLIVTLHQRPVVAVFYILAAPLAAGLIRFFSGRMSRRNQAYREAVESMSAVMSEMIQMIPITRAHAAEEAEIRRVGRHLETLSDRGRDLDLNNELFASSTWVCFNGFQFICLFFSAVLCWRGWMSVGEVVLYQGLFAMIIAAVNGLLAIYPQLTAGLESIRSIGEVLESPDIEQNEGKLPVRDVEGRLTFEHVGFRYRDELPLAIAEFTLEIAQGECVAFVGESGSGKSTLMNLVIGFRRPVTGRILLDGRDMASLNLRDFRRFLAVVPQRTILFSGSVRENITYGLDNVSEELLQYVIDVANVREFAEKLPQGLQTPIGEHGKKLSGGQQQRLAIARAMLRDPRVIILDEATSALDVISEHLVQEAIGRLAAGRTTLIVAHRLSTIRNADRVVVLKDGRCIESGAPKDLAARNGAFSRLRSLQV